MIDLRKNIIMKKCEFDALSNELRDRRSADHEFDALSNELRDRRSADHVRMLLCFRDAAFKSQTARFPTKYFKPVSYCRH